MREAWPRLGRRLGSRFFSLPLSQPDPRAAAVLVDEQLEITRPCALAAAGRQIELCSSRSWFATHSSPAIFFNGLDPLPRAVRIYRGLVSSANSIGDSSQRIGPETPECLAKSDCDQANSARAAFELPNAITGLVVDQFHWLTVELR